jgi:hypothetical protein
MINFIGELLRAKECPEENIDRLKSLWDDVISKNTANQSKYRCVLKEFQLWYGYGHKFFSDGKWLLDQMHNLVVNYKIDMDILFHNIKEALQEDLPIHTRKVFEIVKDHSETMAEKDIAYIIEFIKEILKYIKNNSFEKDNSLKHDKDAFINELGKKYGYKLFNELEEYLDVRILT